VAEQLDRHVDDDLRDIRGYGKRSIIGLGLYGEWVIRLAS
jgi:hypothetical protein